MADAYDVNGYVGKCSIRFTPSVDGRCYYSIFAESDGFAEVAAFSSEERGCISTSWNSAGWIRYWFTSAVIVNGVPREYWIVIIESFADGARIFFKTAPADKSKLSESKRMYVISSDDYSRVTREWIAPATKCLRIVPSGDLFGDKITFNEHIIK